MLLEIANSLNCMTVAFGNASLVDNLSGLLVALISQKPSQESKMRNCKSGDKLYKPQDVG